MKKILLSVFAVAALASCVEDLGAGDAINFGAPFVGNTTKAADPSYGTPQKDGEGNLLPESPVALTKFDVYGTVQGTGAGVVNIFGGETVTGSVGNNVWSCPKTQYWIPGATYNFAAVVDADVDTDDNGMPKTLTTVAISDTDPSKCFLKDMLYDTETTTGSEGHGAVNFAFSHLLAKAQFVVTSTTTDGYYYNVKGIKIHNYATGVYTISTGKWDKESATTDTAYDLGDILNVTAANTKTNATQVLLIPTATTFKVEFIVELRNSNGVDANGNQQDVLLRTIDCTGAAAKVVDIKDSSDNTIGLQAGHAYNFNLALTQGTEIQFTVTNHPTWANGDVNLGL